MPTLTFNVVASDAVSTDGDAWGENADDQFRQNDKWIINPGQFGDAFLKGRTSRNWSMDRFLLTVPEGATVRRITYSRLSRQNLTASDLMRFCILDPQPAHSQPSLAEDGLNSGNANWLTRDPTRDTPFVWSDFEPIAVVRDSALVDRPHPEASSQSGFGGQESLNGFNGSGTLGNAFTVETASFTLGEILFRASRTISVVADSTDANTSLPGVNLFIEIYNAISATDRRPSGSPIATSNPVPWDDMDWGATPGPDPTTANWPTFTFTAGPTLVLGNTYVYKLISDQAGAGGLMPFGFPFFRYAIDQGWTTSAGERSPAFTNNAAGVWWGTGGFGGHAYPPLDGFPNMSESDEGPLVAGRAFQNDECRAPTSGGSLSFVLDTRFVWGFDLDGGPGINHEFDGTHPDDTTTIVQLFQDWIDRPAYDETGTLTATILDPVTTGNIERLLFATSEDPIDVGTELIVGWVLVPTKATNPSPANLASGISINSPDPDLSWTAGTYPGTATGFPTHDVYFGTNPSPGVAEFQGNQVGTLFTFVDALELDTTYFWRIDEVGPFGTTTGDVWQFTTTALPCDWLDDATGAKFAGPESGDKFSNAEAGAAFSAAGTAEWFDSDTGEAFESDQVGAKFSDPEAGAEFAEADTGEKFSDPEAGAEFAEADTGEKFSDSDTADWFTDQECD